MPADNPPAEQPGIRRRTVTQAIAWAAPAVLVAAPVPAHAASGPAPAVFVGTACKLFSDSPIASCPATIADGFFGGDLSRAFAFTLRVTNSTPKTIVVRSDIALTNARNGEGEADEPFTVVGIAQQTELSYALEYCSPVAPGEERTIVIYATSDHDPFSPLYIDITIPWGHACDDDTHLPVFIPDLYSSGFATCTESIPFPSGDATCIPLFYQP